MVEYQRTVYSIIMGKKSAQNWLDTNGSDVSVIEALNSDFIPEEELTSDYFHFGEKMEIDIKYFQMGWKLGLKYIYNFIKQIDDDDPWFEDPFSNDLLTTSQAIEKFIKRDVIVSPKK